MVVLKMPSVDVKRMKVRKKKNGTQLEGDGDSNQSDPTLLILLLVTLSVLQIKHRRDIQTF